MFWFTVIYLLGYRTKKIITVDGEELLLRIADTTGEERFYTMDSYMYYFAKVSWSFEKAYREHNYYVQVIIVHFIPPNIIDICIFHTDISPLSFSIGYYVGL